MRRAARGGSRRRFSRLASRGKRRRSSAISSFGIGSMCSGPAPCLARWHRRYLRMMLEQTSSEWLGMRKADSRRRSRRRLAWPYPVMLLRRVLPWGRWAHAPSAFKPHLRNSADKDGRDLPYAETQDARKHRAAVLRGAFDIPVAARPQRTAQPKRARKCGNCKHQPDRGARHPCLQRSGRQRNLIAQSLLCVNYPELRETNLCRVRGVDHDGRSLVNKLGLSCRRTAGKVSRCASRTDAYTKRAANTALSAAMISSAPAAGKPREVTQNAAAARSPSQAATTQMTATKLNTIIQESAAPAIRASTAARSSMLETVSRYPPAAFAISPIRLRVECPVPSPAGGGDPSPEEASAALAADIAVTSNRIGRSARVGSAGSRRPRLLPPI